MVISNEKNPMLLIYKGVPFEKKVTSIEKSSAIHNNNNRRNNESEKRFVKTPAVILRIPK